MPCKLNSLRAAGDAEAVVAVVEEAVVEAAVSAVAGAERVEVEEECAVAEAFLHLPPDQVAPAVVRDRALADAQKWPRGPRALQVVQRAQRDLAAVRRARSPEQDNAQRLAAVPRGQLQGLANGPALPVGWQIALQVAQPRVN